jgi:hypothetical protein
MLIYFCFWHLKVIVSFYMLKIKKKCHITMLKIEKILKRLCIKAIILFLFLNVISSLYYAIKYEENKKKKNPWMKSIYIYIYIYILFLRVFYYANKILTN